MAATCIKFIPYLWVLIVKGFEESFKSFFEVRDGKFVDEVFGFDSALVVGGEENFDDIVKLGIHEKSG